MTGDCAAVWRAPAKLTRSLRITGVRTDGFHLLDAEMVSLEWGDDLVIGVGDELVVEDRMPWSHAADGVAGAAEPAGAGLAGPPLAVPTGSDNLVARALAAVGRRAAVRLVKRVPPGGGLGGGSSDAAAILRWAGVRPDAAGLALAAGLGADVPFCLAGGRARVTGIGEGLEPLPPVDGPVSLLLLPFGVSTPAVYREWDRQARVGRLSDPDIEEGSGPVNDLEAAALAVEPRLGLWRHAWAAATGLEPRLAGSGSTWFVEEGLEDMAGPFTGPEGMGPPAYVVVTRTGRP